MLPNPYVLDELARLQEEETKRRVKYAWVTASEGRPVVRQRLWPLLVIGSVVIGSLIWRLA